MKIRIWSAGAMALALLCFGALPAQAQLAAALQYVWGQNLDAYDREDVNGTMATINTRSPDYTSTKAAIEQQFKDWDGVKAELAGFEYIGHDDEFAYARVKTKTTGQPGSGFANNITDALVIFHQEGANWKVWSEKILGVQYLS